MSAGIVAHQFQSMELDADLQSETTNSSIFPNTASFISETSDRSLANAELFKDQQSSMLNRMERLNLLQKYNGIQVNNIDWKIQEHGAEYCVRGSKNYVQFKPKLKKQIQKGKFARWFQVVDPNARIKEDIKMAKGILRKDRFQTLDQLDKYLGLEEFIKRTKEAEHHTENLDRQTQYQVKKVRNKLKHWNAMFDRLQSAVNSVKQKNETIQYKCHHINQICSNYIGRSERAVDYFYAEPAAHFMLNMVMQLQQKVTEARKINHHYQHLLMQDQ